MDKALIFFVNITLLLVSKIELLVHFLYNWKGLPFKETINIFTSNKIVNDTFNYTKYI